MSFSSSTLLLFIAYTFSLAQELCILKTQFLYLAIFQRKVWDSGAVGLHLNSILPFLLRLRATSNHSFSGNIIFYHVSTEKGQNGIQVQMHCFLFHVHMTEGDVLQDIMVCKWLVLFCVWTII